MEAKFDDLSELMPKEKVARTFLSNPLFDINVYEEKPKRQKTEDSGGGQCWNRQISDAWFVWNEKATASHDYDDHKGVIFEAPRHFEIHYWKPNTGIMEQQSIGVFKGIKNPKMLSAMDFRGKYAVLFVADKGIDLTYLGAQIGPLHFNLDFREEDDCGNFLFTF